MRRAVLCILDGWGLADAAPTNAVSQADTPHFDRLMQGPAASTLSASGPDVGLPEGQFGNSEVGHVNIGAGRIVPQTLERISNALVAPSGHEKAALDALVEKTGTARCHLFGLMSQGGVHSHVNHLIRLTQILSDAGVSVMLHLSTDGRDTPPQSAHSEWQKLSDALAGYDATLATVSGRYFSMDRDHRWERVGLAYRAIMFGDAPVADDFEAVINAAYAADTNDEFIEPRVIGSYAGFQEGDTFLCANFRSDRVRQMMAALVDPTFDGFERPEHVFPAHVVNATSYSPRLDELCEVLFPSIQLKDTLGEWLAAQKLKQLRVAETEKYPHVSFFFNGGEDIQYDGEDRQLVASPKVSTYNHAPEMSASGVRDVVTEAIRSEAYDFILVNFANPDMVGHTGDIDAATQACTTVDQCLGEVLAAAEQHETSVLVIADHGNCEVMYDPVTDGPHTAHTTNPVPCLLWNHAVDVRLNPGRLGDVAPTLLEMMGIPQPEEMTGQSLILREGVST